MPVDHDPEVLLTLWECGLGQPASLRDQTLLHSAAGGAAGNLAAPASVGATNAQLMALHTRLFGADLALFSHCPDCRTTVQFGADCAALAARLAPCADAGPQRFDTHGYLIDFRLPTGADVAAASDQADANAFAQALLSRCILACCHEGQAIAAIDLPAPVLEALSERMELLDPGASVFFGLDCPECAAQWQAQLDIGDMLWQRIKAAAERLLLDIDALARAYGWSEREVLRLRPVRRAAYLQMVAP